ncbi:hypothetical protein KKI90_18785 [Xenorhabdus bovienii]|uniref:hypothetical protein n=1 Tax=Xenorhabdus bovienii TaxID=40576 RepID=UPI00237CAF23|nr:hypothetical protein [Xenorhabdus bovienii]MDE1488358.1 hypothetical protein [Xenorhabdus bovienii]MDE9479193.1 hypothetical protein [Xenorhabdus bovienii]MDE9532013.1 hypothetical protein [Xenorhabdus bovienii]
MVKKIMLLAFAAFLGAGIVMLVQWMRPPTEDPYFFLTPKPTTGHPIEVPIKLYKKGEKIELVFWNVPQPPPKILYLFPGHTPEPRVMLKTKRHKEGELTYYTPDLFKNDGPLAKPKDAPILSMKLHKINEDLTETLVFKKTYSEPDSIAGTSDGILFRFVSLGERYKYGQYRLNLEILGDWPELKNDNVSYYLFIPSFSGK